jgi:peptidyl-prolyl cis-trans isomerase C
MVGQDPGAKARRERLEKFIDSRIMVQKARTVGLEQDSSFQRRLKEFKKSTLVNMHRANIAEKLSPSDDEIREYFIQNKDKIVIRELRKVQMVVLKTKEEAAAVKQKITTGEITFFQAASDYSIDPNAKMNLGELGWVPQGTGFAELDKVTFALNPNEIGGPVKSPAGWHLVQVQDVRDGNFQDIDDRETWKKTRRLLIHEKENNYVINLRKTTFPVKVHEDVFSRLIQKEVDAMKAEQGQAGSNGKS